MLRRAVACAVAGFVLLGNSGSAESLATSAALDTRTESLATNEALDTRTESLATSGALDRSAESFVASAALQPAPTFVVHFLDVPGGDATWISTPGGNHNYLVNCGPVTYAKQLMLVLATGMAKLDGLVVSDSRPDRLGGCAEVIRGLRPDFVLMPKLDSSSPALRPFNDAVDAIKAKPQAWTYQVGMDWQDGVTATVLNPASPDASAADAGDTLSLAIDYGGVRVLFIDDDGNAARTGSVGTAQVVALSSHASAAIGSSPLLSQAQPSYVIASTRSASPQDGPDTGVLATFQSAVPPGQYLTTANNGTVSLFIDATSRITPSKDR